VASTLNAWELSQFMFLLLANILLLILGCVLEGTTILLVFVPVLLPTAHALGVDMVHFGVVVVVNVMIGLCTPPYGLLLFMMVKVTGVPLKDLVRELIPFLAVMIVVLALLTYVPWITLAVPRLFGYQG
jgi:C4-dicarboxylate transporter DctM subunit